MRPIHKVRLDKVRPALILTREVAVPFLRRVTVAPISSTIHGIATEVPVGPRNHPDFSSVVSCDNIATVASSDVLDRIGFLHESDEPLLTEAIRAAFDLD